MSFMGAVRRSMNQLLRPVGLELRRVADWDEDARAFLPFTATMDSARRAGLSITAYVDRTYNLPGATEASITQMKALGAFDPPIERVCEIGPGSGRYLLRVKEICRPAHYEIYETAPDWAEWLVREHGVVLHPTDGRLLSSTPSRSIDLVHAHKVFQTVPTVTALRYLREMARVVRPGGRVVFDAMTEECLEPAVQEKWCAASSQHGVYPAVLPRSLLLQPLESAGLQLRGSFRVPMEPGATECFVFAQPQA